MLSAGNWRLRGPFISCLLGYERRVLRACAPVQHLPANMAVMSHDDKHVACALGGTCLETQSNRT